MPIADGDSAPGDAAALREAGLLEVSRRLSRNQIPPKYPDVARLPNSNRV